MLSWNFSKHLEVTILMASSESHLLETAAWNSIQNNFARQNEFSKLELISPINVREVDITSTQIEQRITGKHREQNISFIRNSN